jgi:hypothetical protein
MTDKPISDYLFEITQPLNEYEYTYSIKWIKQDGQQINKSFTDSSGIVFIDNL